MTKASEDLTEQWERRARMRVKSSTSEIKNTFFSVLLPLTITVFMIQGLPGIDGKDGTPGIPGIKVWTTIMLLFLNILNRPKCTIFSTVNMLNFMLRVLQARMEDLVLLAPRGQQ